MLEIIKHTLISDKDNLSLCKSNFQMLIIVKRMTKKGKYIWSFLDASFMFYFISKLASKMMQALKACIFQRVSVETL